MAFRDRCSGYTPLWRRSESYLLKDLRVGISKSDVASDGYSAHNLHQDHLNRLSQDVARHLLARSATLIYGGDLREDGFTQFILEEAIALKNRLDTDGIHVENHLAWPLYVTDSQITAWRVKYTSVMKTVEYETPNDIAETIDTDNFIPPSSTNNKYVWSWEH